MFKQRFSKVLALVLAVVLLSIVAITAYAGYNYEPFESESYYSYGGPKNGPFSLTYLGRGGGRCDGNDYRFRVNVNQSYPRNDWKMYSNSSYYRRTPSGRIPYGHELNSVYNQAHICFGASEFSRVWHPFTYWTVSGVQQNVYTWRR